MDILKFVEALPDSVKNIVISALLNSSIAMKNVEQDVRSVDAVPTPQHGQRQQQQGYRRQSPASLLESMRQGEYNSEYVNYFYEVLKKADDLVNNSTPEQMRLLAERYGMGGQALARYDLLDKKRAVTHGDKSIQQVRREEQRRRTTVDDNFAIEKMVTNRKHLQNVLDHSIGAKPIYKYSINVQRMFQTKYNLEHITEYLHVKELASERNGRILEFYIPKNVGLKDIAHSYGEMFNEIINIVAVSFNDDYGQPYNYRIQGFYKLGENGMYDVIKFRGYRVENIGFLK